MSDRIHACLDGELPREALTPAELSRLAALEASIQDIAEPLRAMPAPDLTARVMESLPVIVPAERSETLMERVRRWLWQPRAVTVRFRPAYAISGLAFAALGGIYAAPQVMEDARPAAGQPRVYVQFRLEAPGASEVALAGSFTGWKPEQELREIAPGVWTALVPLSPGVHDYTFVVDGERWIPDPHAPQVDDDFGGINSRLFLPPPVERT